MKKIFFVALFFLCALVATAKNVSVTVSPETAVILNKNQVVPAMSPGVYSLNAGLFDRVFIVQADGYDPQQFVLNTKSPNTMQISLQPNRKNVSIAVEPADAIISVNGIEVGQGGSAQFVIKKGESASLKLVADGYDTYVKRINFNDYESVDMNYNISMIRNRKTVNVLVDADAAEFFVDGIMVASGKNSASFDLKKGKKVQLVVRAPGYLEYSRSFTFDSNGDQGSFNLTKDMAVDHAYAASEPGADVANKKMEFMIKKSMSREQAIQRMKYFISEEFETLEINDNTSGWYRTAWNKEAFDNETFVRTRVEIKEVPDNGDGQLKFKFLLQSQITGKKDAKDEDYHDWGRVLKKYAKLVRDVQNTVN